MVFIIQLTERCNVRRVRGVNFLSPCSLSSLSKMLRVLACSINAPTLAAVPASICGHALVAVTKIINIEIPQQHLEVIGYLKGML